MGDNQHWPEGRTANPRIKLCQNLTFLAAKHTHTKTHTYTHAVWITVSEFTPLSLTHYLFSFICSLSPSCFPYFTYFKLSFSSSHLIWKSVSVNLKKPAKSMSGSYFTTKSKEQIINYILLIEEFAMGNYFHKI